MWKWLQKMDTKSSGSARIARQFGRMLENGRHIFDSSSNAFLGGADPEVIREDLFRTDKAINHLEQEIRRELLVHVTVYGTSQTPQALVMMSIVKDAERIGDYCKNLFDLAVVKQKTRDDEYHADLVRLKDQISGLLGETHDLFFSQDVPKAKACARRSDEAMDHCDAQLMKLVGDGPATTQPALTALAYRYQKRIVAHALNIVTSIFMPVDQLDYFDEDRATRE